MQVFFVVVIVDGNTDNQNNRCGSFVVIDGDDDVSC